MVLGGVGYKPTPTTLSSTVTDDLITLCKSALIIALPDITVFNIVINTTWVNKAAILRITQENPALHYTLLSFVLS